MWAKKALRKSQRGTACHQREEERKTHLLPTCSCHQEKQVKGCGAKWERGGKQRGRGSPRERASRLSEKHNWIGKNKRYHDRDRQGAEKRKDSQEAKISGAKDGEKQETVEVKRQYKEGEA